MTLQHVLIILFSVFFLAVILFFLWEKKGVNKSSPLKIQIVDDLFTLFYFFMVIAILVLLILALRDKGAGQKGFLFIFSAILSSLSISGCVVGLSSKFYRESRQLRGVKTPEPSSLAGYHGLANSYQSMVFFGLLGIHFFVYFILSFVLDVPVFMTMNSLPFDLIIFFVCALGCLFTDYLIRVNYQKYKYLSFVNVILIFPSFWMFGKNINSLSIYNPYLFFGFLGAVVIAIFLVSLLYGNSLFKKTELYENEKSNMLTLARFVSLSNLWIEPVLIVGFIISLIINISLGLL